MQNLDILKFCALVMLRRSILRKVHKIFNRMKTVRRLAVDEKETSAFLSDDLELRYFGIQTFQQEGNLGVALVSQVSCLL